MTGKKIDLFDLIDDWLIPIALIELFVFTNMVIISMTLKISGVI